MKRKSLLILLVLALVVTALLLVGCSGKKLQSPRDLQVKDGYFAWSKVDGANGYMVYFNEEDGYRFWVWDNFISVSDENIKPYLNSGEDNCMWVRAAKLDDFGTPVEYSDRSRLDFKFMRQLDKPKNLTSNSETSTLTWRKVAGATEYFAVVDGQEYKINYQATDMGTVGTIASLPNGEYKLKIYAKGKGYMDSELSDAVDFVQTMYGELEDGESTPSDSWTVTFDYNYEGSKAYLTSCKDNGKVAKPETPTRPGYVFDKWCWDEYGLIEAKFSSKTSTFSITSDSTFYAKWKEIEVKYTNVFIYSTWDSVLVKPYAGDVALFTNDGIQMTVVKGLSNWFKASINEETTRVVFTNGEEELKLDFDKSMPYYNKNGVWASDALDDTDVPDVPDIPDNPDVGQYLIVNGHKCNMELNPNPDLVGGLKTEYMITIHLEIGDVIKIVDDNGIEYSNYEDGAAMNGVVDYNGEYTFYVKLKEDGSNSIWVEMQPDSLKGTVVYYYNVNNWSSVYAHIWTDSTPFVDWPGSPMTPVEGHDGWYQIETGDYDNIIFNDGKKDGAAQTADLVINKTNNYYNGYNWVDDFVEPNLSDTRTIYFYNSKGWTNVSVYMWSGSATNADWPGVAMKSAGDGWYYIEVPIALPYDKIIFNDGKKNGAAQTDDLDLPQGTDCYYNDGWVAGK